MNSDEDLVSVDPTLSSMNDEEWISQFAADCGAG